MQKVVGKYKTKCDISTERNLLWNKIKHQREKKTLQIKMFERISACDSINKHTQQTQQKNKFYINEFNKERNILDSKN